MTRITIMLIAGALALVVLFALFYVAGIAIGVAVIPVIILAVVGLVVWTMVKRRGAA
jgi:hypothetical protein